MLISPAVKKWRWGSAESRFRRTPQAANDIDGVTGGRKHAPFDRHQPQAGRLAAGELAQLGAGAVQSVDIAAGAALTNLNATSQSAVASGGLVLSAKDNNVALVSAGYVKLGTIDAGGGGWP